MLDDYKKSGQSADEKTKLDGQVVGSYKSGAYDKYRYNASESDASQTREYDYSDNFETTSGHYKVFKESEFGATFLVDSYHYNFDLQEKDWDYSRTYHWTTSSTGYSETLDTVERRGMNTSIETKRYQAEDGTWYTVAPSSRIGDAYRFNSSHQQWTRDYVRTYDSSYNGVVNGANTYDNY